VNGYDASPLRNARLIVSLTAVLAAGGAVLLASHGGSLDLGVLVYALPVVAVLLALMGAAVTRIARPYAPATTQRRRLSRGWGMALGVAGFATCAYLFVGADAAARVYASDAACSQGFAANAPSATCRLAPAHILRAFRVVHHRGGDDYNLDVQTADAAAARTTVTLGRNRSGDVFGAALDGRDTEATVQYFRDTIVMVGTNSGTVETTSMPASRAKFFAIFGIICGIFGIVYGLFGPRR